MKTVGSRAEVWHGTAKKTSGGLLKKDLKKNKRGKIVSKKMSNRAKKEKRLEKAGYKTKKGVFKKFSKKIGGNNITNDKFQKKFNNILNELKAGLKRTYNIVHCFTIQEPIKNNECMEFLKKNFYNERSMEWKLNQKYGKNRLKSIFDKQNIKSISDVYQYFLLKSIEITDLIQRGLNTEAQIKYFGNMIISTIAINYIFFFNLYKNINKKEFIGSSYENYLAKFFQIGVHIKMLMEDFNKNINKSLSFYKPQNNNSKLKIYYNNLIVLKEVTSKTAQDLHQIIGIFNSLLGTIDNSIEGRCDFGKKVVERKLRTWYGRKKLRKICMPYNTNNKTRINNNIHKLYKYAYQYIESEKAYKKI